MSRVFWDTNLFIYLFESYGPLSKQVAALRRRMISRGDQLLTSAMTLAEVLVKPNRSGDAKAVSYYQKSITSAAIVVPFGERAALEYARIRTDPTLRAPDAIQLACAATEAVDLFITNDVRLHSKRVPGIHFIAPLDRVPI